MLFKHLLAYLLPNLAQVIASFGTVFILTRYLSNEDYGLFNDVFIKMTIFHYIFFTWAEAAAGRFFANAREENNVANHFKTIFVAYFVNCFLFTLVVIGYLLISPSDEITRSALAAAFAGSIIRSLLKIAFETRRMNLQAMRYAIVDGFHIIFGFILTAISVVFLGFKQDGPFIATLIAGMCALGFELPDLIKSANGGKFDKKLAISYIKFGYPISLNLIAAAILYTGDRLIMGPLLGHAQVGIYSAGYQVAARIMDTFFLYVSSATFPLLVNAFESKDKEWFENTAKHNFALRVGLGAPIAIGIALVAHPLCEILIGPSMREEAAKIAPYIAIASLILGISDYFADAFMLSKHVFERTILMLFPVILNIALNFILLPKLGINGAIVATIVAYIVSLTLMYWRGSKRVKLPVPFDEIGKIIVSLIAMSIGVLLVPNWGAFAEFIAKAIVGASIYGAMAYWLNFANAREMANNIIHKLRRA